MTATSPTPGLRARARRLIGRLGAVAIVTSLLALPTTASPAAAADDEAEPTVTLEVAPAGAILPEAPLTAGVSVHNDTDAPLTEGVVSLAIGRTPLVDGAALDAWLDEDASTGAFETIATQPTEPVRANEDDVTSVLVPASALTGLAPGVYPLRATLSGATTGTGDELSTWDLTSGSVVVIQAAKPADVSVLVPITATPENGSLLTADELADLTGPDGALTAQLDGVAGTTAILAIDPSIPAAIRALGMSAPTVATDWLARLDALPNDRFALQFGDADAATQAHAGLGDLLGPADLTGLMKSSDFATAAPTPTPTSTPEQAEPVLPDNSVLTDIRNAVPGILWPRGDVTGDDLATFSRYLGDDVVTVLPDSSVDGEAGARATAGGRAVLLTDEDVSERLSAAVVADDPTARDRQIAAAAGHLFLTAAAAPNRPLLIGLDRSEKRSADDLRAAVTAVATSGTGLAGLTAAAPVKVETTATPDETRAAALQTMLDDETRLQAFSSILEQPLALLAPERNQMLRVIGVGVSDKAFPKRVAEHRSQTVDTLGSVGIQDPAPVQLFTSAAPLPVWIRNDLPWPVNLTLITQPSDPRLSVQERTPVQAGAASNTRVTVPVEARVGSGEVEVQFRLTSPTGVPVGAAASATVTVRADWEGIGLGILGGVIVLLLGVGVLRTVLRRRRAREASDADAAETDAAPAASEKESE
ncbi:hypothetical protein DY023_06915 [Microbacterium bovistercoris]|uniref:2-oxoglutarate dehydrogenase n=1 Tax=Microbacterium bovistercoris TaxID=2293570 RepID=A0A371NUV0_9MICO|nr:DUF6049 family protein [Microbacterium bovistercoris]REJ06198.1 hypothetical protein DY023_06915 [Microbacterium bovistercoris]